MYLDYVAGFDIFLFDLGISKGEKGRLKREGPKDFGNDSSKAGSWCFEKEKGRPEGRGPIKTLVSRMALRKHDLGVSKR